MDSGIRISDAERDLAITTLWKHLGTGRLNPAEHEERCTRVTAAHTRDELETLFADLPAPHPDLNAALPPTTPTADFDQPENDITGVDVMVVLLGTFLVGPVAAYFALPYGAWWTFFAVGAVSLFFLLLPTLIHRR